MAYQYDAPLSFLVESSSTFVEGEKLARCIWKSVAFSVDNAYFLRHQEARLILKEVGLHNG
jgi:hypothetical protein